MSDDRILVVDEGTTGTRALVFDGHGTRLSASYSEFTQHHPALDRVEHDAEEIWRLTLDRIHDALQSADITAADLVAVGITNQRGTSLLWDRATGEAVTRAIVRADGLGEPLDEQCGLGHVASLMGVENYRDLNTPYLEHSPETLG
jgi:glycerol kinase